MINNFWRISIMQRNSKFFLLLVTVCFCLSAFSQTEKEADPQSVAQILSTYQGVDTTQLPIVYKNNRGFIRFLSATEGGYFSIPTTGQKSLDINDTVVEYIKQNIQAFSGVSENTSLAVESTEERDDYVIIRLTQNYKSFPVFGSGIIVKTTKDGKIIAISCDVLRDDTGLADINLSRPLPIDKAKAMDNAVQFILDKDSTLKKQDIEEKENTYLAVFDPIMLKLSGAPCDIGYPWCRKESISLIGRFVYR